MATLRCTQELPKDNSLWYANAKQCCHQAIGLFPCVFIAVDHKAFQDQAPLKQRREAPLGLIPPLLLLLVGGQVINIPNGQICQIKMKREQLHVPDPIIIKNQGPGIRAAHQEHGSSIWWASRWVWAVLCPTSQCCPWLLLHLYYRSKEHRQLWTPNTFLHLYLTSKRPSLGVDAFI